MESNNDAWTVQYVVRPSFRLTFATWSTLFALVHSRFMVLLFGAALAVVAFFTVNELLVHESFWWTGPLALAGLVAALLVYLVSKALSMENDLGLYRTGDLLRLTCQSDRMLVLRGEQLNAYRFSMLREVKTWGGLVVLRYEDSRQYLPRQLFPAPVLVLVQRSLVDQSPVAEK